MHRDFEALSQVRALRKQLKDLQQSENSSVQFKIGELDKKAAELESTPGGFGAQYLSTPAGRGLARLNSVLSNLLTDTDSADTAPTTQAVAMFAELQGALEEQLGRWTEIQNKDLPALNQQLKQAGLAEIQLNAARK